MITVIPFSGGMNSVYGLHRFLNETDDDIIAIRFTQPFFSKVSEDAEILKAREIVQWLKTNVRNFKYVEEETDSLWVPEMLPIRKGFTNTSNYGIVKFRHEVYKKLADKYMADKLVLGNSLENTATDRFPTYYPMLPDIDIFFCSTPELKALPKPEELNFDLLAATLSGRFEQRSRLPQELQEMVTACNTKHDIRKYPVCWACIAEEISKLEEPKKVDQFFAEKGCYGAWRANADPATYNWRGTGAIEGLRLLGIDISTVTD